ncbi:hypothetical protein OPT61_g9504 [Boeremia exigua]|uniref:Uncharacterized protein n=1 Tax=Boeremia exigua TaxID=749465 RepID=A0ACC2HUB9_9PLEO|nr:hypothetical protein OPT61_g9504 [Boeremia exigua]
MRISTGMMTKPLVMEKDIEPPSGHPALACESPIEPPSFGTPRLRYYQQFPPDDEALTPTSSASDAGEFAFRSSSPAHVKPEPTVLDKMREVLHIHKRH